MGVLGGIAGSYLGGEIAGGVSDLVHGSCRGKKGKAHHKCRKQKQKGRNTAKGLGSAAGGAAGTALEPFKHGGRVTGKKGAPRKIIAHSGEYVLPANAKPTLAQRRIVAKNRAQAKKPPVKVGPKKRKGKK